MADKIRHQGTTHILHTSHTHTLTHTHARAHERVLNMIINGKTKGIQTDQINTKQIIIAIINNSAHHDGRDYIIIRHKK